MLNIHIIFKLPLYMEGQSKSSLWVGNTSLRISWVTLYPDEHVSKFLIGLILQWNKQVMYCKSRSSRTSKYWSSTNNMFQMNQNDSTVHAEYMLHKDQFSALLETWCVISGNVFFPTVGHEGGKHLSSKSMQLFWGLKSKIIQSICVF